MGLSICPLIPFLSDFDTPRHPPLLGALLAGIVEVPCANGFPNNVPVSASECRTEEFGRLLPSLRSVQQFKQKLAAWILHYLQQLAGAKKQRAEHARHQFLEVTNEPL